MYGYYKKTLVRLLNDLKKIQRNPDDLHWEIYQFQNDLIRTIIRIEKKIRKNKEMIAGLKESISIDFEQQRRYSKHIASLRKKNEDYKDIISFLKLMGDGIAFLYIDRFDIKPLAFKQGSGFVSGKTGLEMEKKVLRGAYESGKIAILNDVTNSLRYGDITIPDVIPIAIEVKTGKKRNKRVIRQADKHKKVMDYLINDRVDGLYHEETMERHCCHSNPKNNIDEINQVIDKAYENGYNFTKIEEGLYYCAIVSDNCSVTNVLDEVTIKSPIVFFLNGEKYDVLAYYPLTLAITDPEHIFDFYSGKLVIIVFVDFEVIKERMKDFGVNAEFGIDHEITIVDINSEIKALSVGGHYTGRIGFEFQSLSWFIDDLQHTINRLTGKSGGSNYE